MTAVSMGVSDGIFRAYKPLLDQQASRIESLQMRQKSIDTFAERAAIADSSVSGQRALADRREQELKLRLEADKEFLRENQEILKEQNRLQVEALEIDKKMVQERNRISEIRQIALNVDGEKRLRRSLAAAGINNSPNAVNYLQTKVQEAADTLESMISTNNLTLLKFDNARSELSNSLRQTLSNFEEARTKLNSNFDDNVFRLDEFVEGARTEVLDGLKEDYESLLEQEDKLFESAGKTIEKLVADSLESQKEKEDTSKEDAYKNLVDAFKTFPPGSSFRNFAIQQAKDAGIDVSTINSRDVTIASLKDAKNSVDASLYSPSQFTDRTRQELMRAGTTVIESRLPVAAYVSNKTELKRLLKDNDVEGATKLLEGIVINDMGSGQLDIYNQRKTVIDSTEPLLIELNEIKGTKKGGKLESALNSLYGEDGVSSRLKEKSVDGKRVSYLEDKDFNWYTKELQSVKNKFGIDSDPELQRIFAKVENIASLVINERYGAAVTDGEMARAKEYIATSGNTLGNMIIKLEEYSQFTKQLNANALGVPVFGSTYRSDRPFNLDEPSLPEDMDTIFNQMESGASDFFMGEDSGTGLDLVSNVYSGRRVTLARPAAVAFDAANADFKRDYGVEITVGSERDSSFRDQKETIRGMAANAGIEFDETNPNATAATLREMGRQVADVGYSLHEKGLAVDLHPFNVEIDGVVYTPSEYISLVKPYLERYGIKQANHKGIDPGNFEYSLMS
jgi:hypothetical protein